MSVYLSHLEKAKVQPPLPEITQCASASIAVKQIMATRGLIPK